MTSITSRAALLGALTALSVPAGAEAAPLYTELDVHTGAQPSITARTTGTPGMQLSIRRGEENKLVQGVPMGDCGNGMVCATISGATLLQNDRATVDRIINANSWQMRAIVVYESTPKVAGAVCGADGATAISGKVGFEKHWKEWAVGIVGLGDGATTAGPGVATGTFTGPVGAGALAFVRQSYTYDNGAESGRISVDHRVAAPACSGAAVLPPPPPPVVEPQSPPPVQDTLAPTGTLKLGKAPKLGVLATKGLTSTVTVSEAGAVSQELRLGKTLVGRGSAPVSAAGPVKVTVRLSRSGKRKLRGKRKAELTLTTIAKDATGNTRTLGAKTVRLRR
ncbi:MAG: hypothetical protein JHC95_14465 [Solirubrobacteraceae bacterium]|nr:hypothetical protein [Solirubrobacteraceae bacterium]